MRLLLILAIAVGIALPASVTDLSRIDRTIKMEPAYRHAPKYALLVYGTEARDRVWPTSASANPTPPTCGESELDPPTHSPICLPGVR